LLTSGDRTRHIEAIVAPGLDAHVDDEVELRMEPDNLLRAAFFVYGVPMVGAIAGASAAYWLSLGDAGAALMALAGLALGVLSSRWRVSQSACMRQFTPRIERLC
jgi:positive regulator of sigma E activity